MPAAVKRTQLFLKVKFVGFNSLENPRQQPNDTTPSRLSLWLEESEFAMLMFVPLRFRIYEPHHQRLSWSVEIRKDFNDGIKADNGSTGPEVY
jgi:hypothetical protein